ncbi:Di-copper centre-containing [Glarea lozoyensis ATCC 20868]|uniref:Di-copper centre-containing n=1 Tax=Glarea lozoyensis (strain ATCC 20868 / MF5171) TaxID=1116229 RepID=S3D638_GLAL2|nr:Di-copper centre-containing [Glarea lozoyensis ATCC 20868]EPE27541.1 Di-copper centre-containing [Glarea lozoyensis ATCC 20868]
MLLTTFVSGWSVLLAATVIDVASAKFALTGVFTGVDAKTGYRPPRREIEDLAGDVKQFSLYVQAVNAMMKTDERELTSYFQIGGIHGLPYISWDGVNPSRSNQGSKNTGYCTHGNTLFGTWHRPYMAIFEQIMAQKAQAIAKTYTSDKAAWQTAADKLRSPFWDWAAPPVHFPAVLKAQTVQITTPTGVKSVSNPLYSYKFLNNPEINNWFPSDYLGTQKRTLRYPNQATNTSNDDFDDRAVAEDPTTSGVWNVFSKTSNFNEMSTSSTGGYTFEGPHSTIHIIIGGGGHFSPPDYAAFDPLFYLHHGNVDRQIAMWQAIYPNSYLTPANTTSGTWTITVGDVLDENTALTPFTQGDGRTPWTSKAARQIKTFGYSYPDVPDWLFTNPRALAANVTARVNKLYNADGSLGPFGTKIKGRAAPASDTLSWSIAAKVANSILDEPFSVKLTVGDVRVGRLSVLIASTTENLEASTFGEFELSAALKDVDVTDVDAVVTKLKGSVKYTVVKADGTTVDGAKAELSVSSQVVTPAKDVTEFPVFAPSNERIFDMLVKKRKSYKRRRKELVKGYEKDFNAAVGVKREWVDVLVGMSDKERRGLNYYIGRPSPLNPAPKKSASINEHADELLEKWQDARTVCRKKAFEYETMQFRLVFNIKNQRRFREMLGEKEVRRVKERVKKGKGL